MAEAKKRRKDLLQVNKKIIKNAVEYVCAQLEGWTPSSCVELVEECIKRYSLQDNVTFKGTEMKYDTHLTDILFREKAGAKLDVGCGSNKQKGWIGMDKRRVKGVDIVHDVQNFPWPVPDDSCFQVLLSHLWEHIEPKYRMDLMEELWRIIQKNGQLLISVPYCMSMGAFQDPTHYPCPTEATFTYFDPDKPLYGVYKPSPWFLRRNNWQANGNMEVILEPRK